MMELGHKLKVAVMTLLFKKVLRVPEDPSSGEMSNLITVNAQRFEDIMNHFNVLWAAPIQLIIATYFLYELVGVR